MKSTKESRRIGALERLKKTTWQNAKSNRLGTKTQTQWEKYREEAVKQLTR